MFDANYIGDSTVKLTNNISKYLQISCFFTGNITHTPRFGETMNINASFSLSRSSIARFRPNMIFTGIDPQLSLIHFGETMNLNCSSALSCSSFSFCSPFLPDYHLYLPHQIVFFVGAAPPLSPDHSAGRKQQFAAIFHCFSHFSTTFIAIHPHIQPGLTFLSFRSPFFLMSPGLLLTNQWPSMLLTGPPFHCRRRNRLSHAILLLLIIGGVEVNPGPSSSLNLNFGLLNTRSGVNKAPLLHCLITDNDLSFLALTETWVKTDDPPVIKNDPAPPGYRITHVHRDNPDQTRGGGLAVIHRDEMNVLPRKHNITHSSFELQLVNIGLKSRDIVLANIYRPPSSSKSIFLEEFGSLLATLGTDAADHLMISGDFNLPGTSSSEIDDDLADLLNSTGFTQHISSPTRHDSNHTKSSLLDLIITPSTSTFISTTSVVSSHEISDHDLALANLTTKRYKSPQRTYQYRDIKNIDLDLFKQNILSSSLFSDPNPTVDGYADQMETEITSLLNTVAPLKTGHRSGPRKAKNWLSPDATEAKKRRRRLERRWKASNAESDRFIYRAACSSTNKLIKKSRAASNIESINEASKNPKRLWSTIKSLLHSSPPSEQVSPSISQPLANSLASFFHQKIVALKESISLKLLGNPSPFDFDQPHCNEFLSDFMPVTPAEVSKLLQSMSNKSSQLDYIPTSLLKSCADIFSILSSHLANLSFTQATFPSNFKLALISPLLKKPGLPKSELSNFRPISNLNTIGKILKRLALARLFPHISISPSFCPLQSAYRKFHSTETALLKLTNDIMETIDSGKITILTALDMSAAFDTLDHATLLHRLEHTFGLSGFVISWIRSYLTNRSSFVKIDSSSSPSATISTGVPQGSVLGPLLFVLFISPVANVINPDLSETTNLVSFHQYADDTQLYIGTNASTLVHQVASIESCTQRVHNWLLNNGLHLNPSKSEAIAFFNPRSKPLEALAESIKSISVAGSPIKLQSSIKNLGVYLDSRMSFDKQVSETCKASYFHIRALRHIRSSLTTEACKTVAAAIVGSRLDYCNSLLAGTSVSNLARLQLVQNTLARVVAQKPRFCHIKPVLADLHWLPIRHRIDFKIATIAFKVLHFQQPSYLAALVPRYVPTRSLRSSSSLSLCVPSRKTAMARSKSFSSVASYTWNRLPCHLSSISALPAFRKRLKHHLFSSAFPGISSPSTDITLCDVITSTNVNHTSLPPS